MASQAGGRGPQGDVRAVLKIVWPWIERANEGVGGDVDDLIFELREAGFGPVDE